ncbi:hypothetical protein H6G74_17045 [Nostoc spongiaeforme FACHB-130]|uniref:Uncharacterized protein n=1 Tax=Nostoc spongiaeforme FACHB-130 TaxID=1357510 RepID=A0ABR8FX99_9NOSO|nr:hypothetical protein [Nostoc spongiaeforme]MBD2596018.1 hypothetical protein [Nostoc spongiaeforme FACHB-130]
MKITGAIGNCDLCSNEDVNPSGGDRSPLASRRTKLIGLRTPAQLILAQPLHYSYSQAKF